MNDIRIQTKKVLRSFFIVILIIIFTILVLFLMNKFKLINKKYYTARDFNIKTIYSNIDYDHDNLDDYSDFVLGARKDAENHPKYIRLYYEGGYPPDNEGVCTDVIWRAFKNAGYSLKDMIDKDIELHPEDYKNITNRDPNIDFRRVENLNVYFKNNAISLTTDLSKIEEWQGGDIVVFKNHIGIVSDKRNKNGIPFLIHHASVIQLNYEEDILESYDKDYIIGHYRISL